MKESDFVEKFRDVFEHSPWIPQRAWMELNQRIQSQPNQGWDQFTFSDYHQAMVEVIEQSNPEEKLSLLRAHPQLAGREARGGDLTPHSQEEQSSAGLDQLSHDEMEKITSWNHQYLGKFGFPFIIAVRHHNKQTILESFQNRLSNNRETEISIALNQVYEIAKIRMSG